ncbi:MAG: glycine betaine ABC transporter substrate-binding protein [Halorhodospira halophila]|uniref:glycine betaine ABC transporter substrate-binding protein n=1 Tax=Halorhodospira TaxID=85108 RepID=UPI00191465D4|nr:MULTISPECIES: glycine betaine ABC transporter substrate-binding protein [Halorhodospira]MBK5942565.1 glycine/betaine ABC transporter substrate-binding protein [Halorhodospira halophila]MCC3751832.1 glycine betaine ABC transporter substrate-binding protein [Halorhodospira halophila]MCG5528991.1 glycine betaine ABC transporter substrate-binding protein [Halorhodospira halophila]MCG5544089.1 glycine betaine ABC transporter substrate-binding protein [Halorhodospira sp. 9628]
MRRKLTTAAATAAITAGMASAANADEIRIGWTAWADAEFITRMAEDVITSEFNTDVELVQTDIAPQYTGLAQGDIDLMLMSWQPITHEDYIEQFGDDIVDLGVLYGDAALGWIVPQDLYDEGLTSIEDLKDPEWHDRLNGQIQGIDPGAGLTRLSHDVIEDYDLDYDLIEASDSAMTAALNRAARRGNAIVVTGWSPHWKFGAWNLTYLEDPEGTLGGAESIHAMSREGFPEDHPEVAEFASCINIDIDLLNEYMFLGREEGTEAAVEQFLDEEADLVDEWIRCARN